MKKTIEQLERELFAYHAAVQKAIEMELRIPTIIQMADFNAFPEKYTLTNKPKLVVI